MSTTEEAFLNDIRANPDDDGIRLIYADWLQEHGQPERAEFIRVQIELARLADDDPRREALEDRQDELLANRGDEWHSPFQYHQPDHARFRRGFLEDAVLLTQDEAVSVLRSAPLRRLDVREVTGKGLGELVRLPEFVQVRELCAGMGQDLPWKGLRLLRSPHLVRLQSLSLNEVDRVPEFLEALVASPHLRALTRLVLTGDPPSWRAGLAQLPPGGRSHGSGTQLFRRSW
jgi:uncharacterized protein (TIGR02996 family)